MASIALSAFVLGVVQDVDVWFAPNNGGFVPNNVWFFTINVWFVPVNVWLCSEH